MLNLIRGEAVAYIRLGLTDPRTFDPGPGRAETGAFFVHGIAGTLAQFGVLQSSLSEGGARSFGGSSFSRPRSDGAETSKRGVGSYADPLWALYPRGDLPELAERMWGELERFLDRCPRTIAVGHSLGGLLLRVALQAHPGRAERLAGLLTVCSPLHGTRMSKIVPGGVLRKLHPGSQLITWLGHTAHRLQPLLSRTLCIGARRDALVGPFSTNFLEGAQHLGVSHTSHVGSLLDPKVLAAVTDWTRARLEAPGGPSSGRSEADVVPSS